MEETYYAFNFGDGTIMEVELTPEELEELRNENAIFETREEAERFANEEFEQLWQYT